MEDVIFGLMFVYFFVIRPIFKQAKKRGAAKKGSQPATAKPRAPLTSLLDRLKEKLKEAGEQMEATKKGGSGDRPIQTWKDLFAEVTRDSRGEPVETKREEGELGGWRSEEPWYQDKQEVAPRSREAVEPEWPSPRAEETGAGAVLDGEGPVPTPHPTPGQRPSRLLGVDLRQAVVWSEILGPPVSLRDEH